MMFNKKEKFTDQRSFDQAIYHNADATFFDLEGSRNAAGALGVLRRIDSRLRKEGKEGLFGHSSKNITKVADCGEDRKQALRPSKAVMAIAILMVPLMLLIDILDSRFIRDFL